MPPRRAQLNDIEWQHGRMLDGKRHWWRCNYCNMEYHGGGVSRLKKHLAGGAGAGYNEVLGCPSVPYEVKVRIAQNLRQMRTQKGLQSVQETRDEQGGFHDQENFPSQDLDVHNTVRDPYEKDYQQPLRESRAEAWARGDLELPFYDEVGISGSGTGTRRHSTSEVGVRGLHRFFSELPHSSTSSQPQRKRIIVPDVQEIEPFALSRENGKQTKIEDSLQTEGPRWKLGRAVAKFFYHAGVPFNAANSPYYEAMFKEMQSFGKYVQPPSAKELAGVYLDAEVEELKGYIVSFKKKWQKYGVTLMCDGWSGTTKSSLINFFVYCDGQAFYYKSVNASRAIHNHQYILQLIEQMVTEIGEEFIVQVVTDNGANFKKVGEELMKTHPHIFWTPCAAHCVDLMLKDIDQLHQVKQVVDAAQNITQCIYNHTLLLSWMRDFCSGDILRPSITRFATNFVALEGLLKCKDGLQQMFRSDQWLQSSFASSCNGKEVEGLINSSNFWSRVAKIVDLIAPLYEVLRVVDDDRTPTMGFVYAKLEAAKKKILRASAKYAQLFINIVDDRWDCQMSRYLQMAAYYLNPAFQYKHELAYNDELIAVVTSVVDRMAQNHTMAVQALNEMKYFREGAGSFAEPSAIAARDRLDPGEWWLSYGKSAPILRDIAIKVLSQTSSSSGCERKLSTFGLMHTKWGSRLSHRRLETLMYVHYNLGLRVKHMQMDAREVEEEYYDPTDDSYLRDDEDPMIDWIADASTERGETVHDEDPDDPGDPPRPNTFLASFVERNGAVDVGDTKQGTPTPVTRENAEVDLDDDIILGSTTRYDRGAAATHENADAVFEI